jgi:hypothetical protein
MKRENRFSRGTVTAILAIASALAGIACSVQKTQDSAGKDTATVSAPTTAAVPPATSSGGATVEDSAAMRRKGAPKPAVKAPAAGGERDSATQAVFEIGPDGKIRRVKR